MTYFASSSRILVLHTSCGLRDEIDDNRDAFPAIGRDTPGASTREQSAISTKSNHFDLSTSSMACDVLILPQFPTDDENDVYRLPQNPSSWNPCGVPNVLVLQEMPSWDKIMLSLTSCVLFLDDEILPVDASPSTFMFDFSIKSEIDFYVSLEADYDEMQNIEETSVQEHMSELDADLVKAQTTIDFVPIDEQPHWPLDGTFQTTRELTKGRDWYRMEQELEALRLVQALMDRDSANLDRLLQVLSWMGCVLLVALIWSGYQLYSVRLQESIRCNLRKSAHRKILLQSELSRSSSSMTHQKDKIGTDLSRPQVDPLTPRVDNRSYSRIDFTNGTITPKRLDFSLVADDTSPPKGAGPSLSGSTTAPIQPLRTRAIVLNNISRAFPPNGGAAGKVPRPQATTINPHNPFTYLEKAVTNAKTESPGRPNLDPSKVSSNSPTSQLVQAWTARKAVRRRARKIKPIQPQMTTTAAVPLFSKAAATTVDSVACKLQQLGTPSLLAPIPDLVCSTPGSDDSFIEDYW